MLTSARNALIGVWEAYWRFAYNDGWAIASHIALSALLALFPFLIFVTALAGFVGSADLAEQVVNLTFQAWPEGVMKPLQAEVHHVLTNQRRDLLTIGGALMLWFSSSGVEAVRIGLNRAYGEAETRWWYHTRTQSIFFVLLGAAGLLAVAFLIVLAPTLFQTAASLFPEFKKQIDEVRDQLFTSRYVITTIILLGALIASHLWLPAGHRKLKDVLPGILITLLLWLVAALAFAWYLSAYSNYVTTYAGFASVLIALIFLYFNSVIFILGGELNAAWKRARTKKTETPGRTLLPIDMMKP
ncbi:MAG: YihY/virulence factor BrkB family protein [Pseudomonadota bacterium]